MQRDLVIRARSGDHDAFATLAAAAVDRLHRTAWLNLRSDADAADVGDFHGVRLALTAHPRIFGQQPGDPLIEV